MKNAQDHYRPILLLGLSFDEIGQDEESSSPAEQQDGRTCATTQVRILSRANSTVRIIGLRVPRQDTFRFSNTGDATITSTATPYASAS